MKGLSVLSFGSTRSLWDGKSAEDYQRMMGYAEQLDQYIVVTSSYRCHHLKPLWLTPRFQAIPANAFCFADCFLRMLHIGRSILRKQKVTVIQAQDPFFTGAVAVLLGKRFRVPVNVCLFGPNPHDENWMASHWSHRFFAPLGRWVFRHCHSIQVDGQMTARSLIAAGYAPERIELKPNIPMGLTEFLAIDRPVAPSPGPVRLLFVGRLVSQKNVPLLIDAIAKLKAKSNTPFTLTVVGDGPEAKAVRASVERHGLGSCVQLRGAVPREAIASVFAEADLFVMTSDYEGYPRVLMEAGAAGLPVVTTAISGSDEAVIDGKTGYVVPVRDGAGLVEKLAALIEDPVLRRKMGAAAREHIRANLDPVSNAPRQAAIWSRVGTAFENRQFRPRHLLLFNLATDVNHPILGFTTLWIRELAKRVESIHVITMEAGEIAVPNNVQVYSVGRELGYSEPRRLFEFYRHLFRILRTEPIDGCFSHMITIFSVLAGPVLRLRGIPLVSWYAHPSLTPTLKLAHFASHRMVTSLPKAYPYRADKLTVIGQGIDTELFAPACKPVKEETILCVGRISRVKNHPTLLRALAMMPEQRLPVVILGATAGASDEEYLRELEAMILELNLGDRVSIERPVAPAELPAHFQRCAVHVNLTPAGFGDKVAWEAMACGRPCLVGNEDFRETLGTCQDELLFSCFDPKDLALKLSRLLSKTPAEREKIGRYLRSQVESLHSLPRLADRVLDEIAACRQAMEQPR